MQILLNRNFCAKIIMMAEPTLLRIQDASDVCALRGITYELTNCNKGRTMNVDAESSASSIGSGTSGNSDSYHRETSEQMAKRVRIQEEEDRLFFRQPPENSRCHSCSSNRSRDRKGDS